MKKMIKAEKVFLFLCLILVFPLARSKSQSFSEGKNNPMIIAGGNISYYFRESKHIKIYGKKPVTYQAQLSLNFIPHLYFTGRSKKYHVKGSSRVTDENLYQGHAEWDQDTRGLGIRLTEGNEDGFAYLDFLAILTTVREHIWTDPFNENLEDTFSASQQGWGIVLGIAPRIADITYFSLELEYIDAVYELEHYKKRNLGGFSISAGIIIGIL